MTGVQQVRMERQPAPGEAVLRLPADFAEHLHDGAMFHVKQVDSGTFNLVPGEPPK